MIEDKNTTQHISKAYHASNIPISVSDSCLSSRKIEVNLPMAANHEKFQKNNQRGFIIAFI